MHEAFLEEKRDPSGDVGESRPAYRDPDETKALILESLRVNGCQSESVLALSLGYKGVNNTFRRCLKELMDEGEIEYLYPDSPKDRRQKICLFRRRDR